MTYPVVVRAIGRFRGVVVFETPDLPDGMTARMTRDESDALVLEVNLTPSAPSGSSVFRLRGFSGNTVHSALFRLTVNPAPTTTAAPTTLAPTTIGAAPSTTIPDFAVRAATDERVVLPAVAAQFAFAVERRGLFTGTVDFAVAGLPAGVTASFSPNPTAADTVLSVTPSDSTPSGRYPLIVTATAGNATRTLGISLVVRREADFSMAIAPPSVTVPAGNDVIVAVNVSPPSGARAVADVDLRVDGLPSGAVATFTPNPTFGISRLRITTPANASAGIYNLSIVGTSGRFIRALPFQMTIRRNVVGFGLTAQPNAQVVAPGATATFAATVTPTGGFSSAITPSVRGVPTGASATITTTATGFNVAIATGTGTPRGVYPVQVTATSGALEATVAVTLTVQ